MSVPSKARNLILILTVMFVVLYIAGCSKKEAAKPGADKMPEVPPEYANKHIPEGWWTDDKIIAEGKELYDGKKNLDVNSAACHGLDGMPVLSGTRDLRDASRVSQWSDSYWFWKVSEGVPDTVMTGWKEKMSEEEIWQVAAYARTFSHGGKAEEQKH